MDLYGPLFRTVLYPAWESVVRERPTLPRLEYLERTQWRSLDELIALQVGALRRLIAHAYANVPFYRRRFEAAGITPEDIKGLDDLRRIPVLTRQEARQTTEERTSLVPPFPTIRKTTGGTTGEPLVFGYEPDSEHWRKAIKLRGYSWGGYRAGDNALHYWGFPTKSDVALKSRVKTRVDRLIRRDHYVDCTNRSDADLRRVVEIIRRERPKLLVCYTQAGGDLARFVIANGLRDWGTIPVICGAERVFAHDRIALEQAFGPTYETYGCREVMLIASECEAHDGLHESMENVLTEILVTEPDGRTRPAREGELGEVVLTDLHNFSMPFIRYANGDLAIAGPTSRCACGRGLRRIRSVEGRITETLRDGSGNPVSGMVFNLIFSVLASTVRQFQAVQHKDGSITLRVIPASGLDEMAMLHIQTNCQKYLKGVSVRVETVTDIPVGKSGKRQPVIVER